MTIDEAEKIKTVVENKDYIVQLVNTVAKNMIEVFENLKIEDVNMFQLGYNKAIDDFANVLKENYDYLPQILSQEAFGLYIDEYAEQLKEGEMNEM